MKRILFTLMLALTVAAAAQFPGLSVEAFGFKQEVEKVTVNGRVKNDGTFAAKNIILMVAGLQGEGDGAEVVATQEYPVGDVQGGDFKKFEFTFESKQKLSSVVVRVKSAKFR